MTLQDLTPVRRPALALTGLGGLLLIALAAGSGAASAAGADLALNVTLGGGGSTRLVGENVSLLAMVFNAGDEPAGPFVVDLWCSMPSWGRHSVSFPAIAPGGNATETLTSSFSAPWNGRVLFFGHADPAGMVNESDIEDNSDTLEVNFVSYETLDVGARLASRTPLQEGDILVFRIELRDGESILFQADSDDVGTKFDQYLLDEPNWENYRDAMRNGSAMVTYFSDFSTIDTNHISFSTSPLAGGRYYLVLDNGAVLEHGAKPAEGQTATITYSVARVGSGLPVELVLLVLAVGAGAVYATMRWKPSFDSTQAVLSVPSPAADDLASEDSLDDAEGSSPGDDGGGEGAREPSREGPPRPPRN